MADFLGGSSFFAGLIEITLAGRILAKLRNHVIKYSSASGDEGGGVIWKLMPVI